MAKKEIPKWRKLGGGSLRVDGKIIKPNQIFESENSFSELILMDLEPQNEAAKMMKDNNGESFVFKKKQAPKENPETKETPLKDENTNDPEGDEPGEQDQSGEEAKATGTGGFYKEETGKGWYNVFNSEGKQQNEKALREAKADELIEILAED